MLWCLVGVVAYFGSSYGARSFSNYEEAQAFATLHCNLINEWSSYDKFNPNAAMYGLMEDNFDYQWNGGFHTKTINQFNALYKSLWDVVRIKDIQCTVNSFSKHSLEIFYHLKVVTSDGNELLSSGVMIEHINKKNKLINTGAMTWLGVEETNEAIAKVTGKPLAKPDAFFKTFNQASEWTSNYAKTLMVDIKNNAWSGEILKSKIMTMTSSDASFHNEGMHNLGYEKHFKAFSGLSKLCKDCSIKYDMYQYSSDTVYFHYKWKWRFTDDSNGVTHGNCISSVNEKGKLIKMSCVPGNENDLNALFEAYGNLMQSKKDL